MSFTDFVTVDDTINVSAAGFGGGLIASTPITADQFLLGSSVSTSTSASQRFLYNTTNGALFYDADGTGALAALQIAMLTGTPSITNADIFVTA